jgi:hypothetical protein
VAYVTAAKNNPRWVIGKHFRQRHLRCDLGGLRELSRRSPPRRGHRCVCIRGIFSRHFCSCRAGRRSGVSHTASACFGTTCARLLLSVRRRSSTYLYLWNYKNSPMFGYLVANLYWEAGLRNGITGPSYQSFWNPFTKQYESHEVVYQHDLLSLLSRYWGANTLAKFITSLLVGALVGCLLSYALDRLREPIFRRYGNPIAPP